MDGGDQTEPPQVSEGGVFFRKAFFFSQIFVKLKLNCFLVESCEEKLRPAVGEMRVAGPPRLATAAALPSLGAAPPLSGPGDVNPTACDSKKKPKEGEKTEQYSPGTQSLLTSPLFRPCECEASGSVAHCSPLDGRCHCRTNVEGQSCSR